MAWQFRRRIKVAPGVRINLSKGGISTSVGVRGANITVGKNGTYLNTGLPGTGIYRRQKISGPSPGKTVAREAYTVQQKKENNGCGIISIIGILVLLVLLTRAEVEMPLLIFGAGVIVVIVVDFAVNMIIESFTKKPSQDEYAHHISELQVAKKLISPEKEPIKSQIIESYISCLQLDNEAAQKEVIIEALVKKLKSKNKAKYHKALELQEASLSDIQRKLDSVRFDADALMNEEQRNTYRSVCERFLHLAALQKIWIINSEVKSNAKKSSAATLIERKEVELSTGTFAFIKSDNKVPILIGEYNERYYLFPTFMLTVYGPTNFQVSPLQGFAFDHHATQFLEASELPTDTEVLGHTFKYVNKNGTPDLRYTDNPRLTIVKYHEINFPDLSLTYQCSNSRVANRFCTALTKHIRYLRNDIDEGRKTINTPSLNAYPENSNNTFTKEYFSLLLDIAPAIVHIVSQLRADYATLQYYRALGFAENLSDAIRYWVIYDLIKITSLVTEEKLAQNPLSAFGLALVISSGQEGFSNEWSDKDFSIVKSAYDTGLYNNVIESLQKMSSNEHPFHTLPKLSDETKLQHYLENYLALPAFLKSVESPLFLECATVLFRFANIMAKADQLVTAREKEILLTVYELTHKPSLRYAFTTKKLQDVPPQCAEDASLKSCVEELETLIGLHEVKKQVTSFINFISVQNERKKTGLKSAAVSYHIVFTGNPGTGKTTVARIVAKIYKEMQILSSGHLVEVDRGGLVAEYTGQTATKVNKTVDSALNGILFIDEAYALVGGTRDDYGKEAVAALIKRIEDDRDKLVVILAGYTDEMNLFLDTNPGIKSRFSRHIHFPDYSPQDLVEIFISMCNKSEYVISEEARVELEKLFNTAYDQRDRSFGNARFARNIFEATIERQANRIAGEPNLTKEKLTLITKDDIVNQ